MKPFLFVSRTFLYLVHLGRKEVWLLLNNINNHSLWIQTVSSLFLLTVIFLFVTNQFWVFTMLECRTAHFYIFIHILFQCTVTAAERNCLFKDKLKVVFKVFLPLRVSNNAFSGCTCVCACLCMQIKTADILLDKINT